MLGFAVSVQEIRTIFRAWFDNALLYVPQVVFGLAVFVLFVLLGGIARTGAVRAFTQASGDRRAGNAWGTIVRYCVLLLGVVVALAVAGVELSAMMVAVGAIGFGLAFALQDTLANFFSGLLILTTHPFARDDAVEVNGAQGVVEEIKIRSTKLKTFDGLKVEVPNKAVLGSNITVFSEHPTRRYDVAVGIGYDDDIEGAIETALEAVAEVEDVLEDPAPDVFVTELGGSSVDLIVRFWVQRSDRASMLKTKGDVAQHVKEALDEAGYDIPFPIRTIYMHDADGASVDDAPPTSGAASSGSHPPDEGPG